MVIYPLCILHTGLPQVVPYAMPFSMLMGSLLWEQSRRWWHCLLVWKRGGDILCSRRIKHPEQSP